MNFQEILSKIKEKHEVLEHKEDLGILNAWIAKEKIRGVLSYMKEELDFDLMNFMSAVDYIENNIIEVIYRVYSNNTGDAAVLRVKLERNSPEIETVSDIYKAAEAMEREAAEMFGVKFKGHPDPRKLLLTDDVVNPLRKDFEHPEHNPMPKV
ncbi:MAG TPA: NADH-quinone oxidoreductase subunit C [Firmicutes bacterium]|nr:NADH-quinone oxidoreductase subunit C [Bacillota bacterium]